jgi:3-methyladenine DNA glycosylase Mpg
VSSQLRAALKNAYPARYLYAKLWALKHYWPAMRSRPADAVRFLFRDPELDNFTYRISNTDELTHVLTASLQVSTDVVRAYVLELECDQGLRDELSARLRSRRDRRGEALYGRRIGWYVMTRLLKPRLIVEAGVHDGLGSSVLLRALERNCSEGHDGHLIGIDVDSTAGWLVPARLTARFTLMVDNSIDALHRIAAAERVDMFLHDSLHSYTHEMGEYCAVWPALADGGVLLSDNAHATSALADFSAQKAWRYVFWPERPIGHFYPGAGIGISLPPSEQVDAS